MGKLNVGRTECVAVTVNKLKTVYVVGGFELERAGYTVERYFPTTDEWKILPVRLPFPYIRAGAFMMSNFQLVILGGTYTRAIVEIEVSYSIDAH